MNAPEVIPFVGLSRQNGQLAPEILAAVEEVLRRGDFVHGDAVQDFERLFAARVGTKYAVAVNSGLDSLWLTLCTLQIEPGAEVITAPNSYVATAAAIAHAGAKPVFADVKADENIDPAKIEECITSKTVAIIPVHLRGRPASMKSIAEIARKYRLHIIEDCSQAVDAEYNGQRVGTFGIAGCFSLHPLKNLGGCGDGGIVTTNDESLYDGIRRIRNHGLKDPDLSLQPCLFWGHNSRLDTTAAAILRIKLRYLDEWTTRRRFIAETWTQELSHLPLVLPIEDRRERCVYQSFTIQVERRDALREFLQERGVITKIHYPVPIHLQPAAQTLKYERGSFPVAEAQSEHILSLPIYPELRDDEVQYISDSIQAFFDT